MLEGRIVMHLQNPQISSFVYVIQPGLHPVNILNKAGLRALRVTSHWCLLPLNMGASFHTPSPPIDVY